MPPLNGRVFLSGQCSIVSLTMVCWVTVALKFGSGKPFASVPSLSQEPRVYLYSSSDCSGNCSFNSQVCLPVFCMATLAGFQLPSCGLLPTIKTVLLSGKEGAKSSKVTCTGSACCAFATIVEASKRVKIKKSFRIGMTRFR